MKKLVLALGLFCAPLGAAAEVGSAVLRDVVDHHILPRYTTLAERTDALAAVAQQNCPMTPRCAMPTMMPLTRGSR